MSLLSLLRHAYRNKQKRKWVLGLENTADHFLDNKIYQKIDQKWHIANTFDQRKKGQCNAFLPVLLSKALV